VKKQGDGSKMDANRAAIRAETVTRLKEIAEKLGHMSPDDARLTQLIELHHKGVDVLAASVEDLEGLLDRTLESLEGEQGEE
jgi:hypothetical protein